MCPYTKESYKCVTYDCSTKTGHLAWSKPHLLPTTYHLWTSLLFCMFANSTCGHGMTTWSPRTKSLVLANSGKAGWNHCSFLHKCLIILSLGLPCDLWNLIFILTEDTTDHGSASGSLGICWTTAVSDAERKLIRALTTSFPVLIPSPHSKTVVFPLLFCFHILCIRWNDCSQNSHVCEPIFLRRPAYISHMYWFFDPCKSIWHVLSPVPSMYGWLKTITTGHISYRMVELTNVRVEGY